MATSSAGDPSQNLLTAVKRVQVKGACQECRRRKEKVRVVLLTTITCIEASAADHTTIV